MQALEALIFDVDGTLADTERDGHRPAFNRAFEEAGLDWEWTVPLYGELLRVTGGKERILHFIRHWRPEAGNRPGLEAFVTGLHLRKTTHYQDLLRGGGHCPPPRCSTPACRGPCRGPAACYRYHHHA